MAKQKHIYVKDETEFDELRTEVKTLWYQTYGESLSNSDILIKAYENLRDSLSGRGDRTAHDIKRQNIYKYCRTGIQD